MEALGIDDQRTEVDGGFPGIPAERTCSTPADAERTSSGLTHVDCANKLAIVEVTANGLALDIELVPPGWRFVFVVRRAPPAAIRLGDLAFVLGAADRVLAIPYGEGEVLGQKVNGTLPEFQMHFLQECYVAYHGHQCVLAIAGSPDQIAQWRTLVGLLAPSAHFTEWPPVAVGGGIL